MSKEYLFKNTKAEFRRWCEEFPNDLWDGVCPRYYKKGDYYMQLQVIIPPSGVEFLGKTFRVYDNATKSFELIPPWNIKGVEEAFMPRIKKYERDYAAWLGTDKYK